MLLVQVLTLWLLVEDLQQWALMCWAALQLVLAPLLLLVCSMATVRRWIGALLLEQVSLLLLRLAATELRRARWKCAEQREWACEAWPTCFAGLHHLQQKQQRLCQHRCRLVPSQARVWATLALLWLSIAHQQRQRVQQAKADQIRVQSQAEAAEDQVHQLQMVVVEQRLPVLLSLEH